MIHIKNEHEMKLMRESCNIVKETLDIMEANVKSGISTLELDALAEKHIRSRGAKPAFKGFPSPYGKPFPGTICSSVNSQVIHGIPSKNVILKEGDIISIDCGAEKNGFFGDAARTFGVGKISKEAQKLIDVTRGSFFEGIEYAKEGNRIGDVSSAIQKYVEKNGFSVVKEYEGHGVGKHLHEEPSIPNYGAPGKGVRLAQGMTLAIEPMVNAGTDDIYMLKDNWTVVTEDDKLSAHYENTILITRNGAEVLTI